MAKRRVSLIASLGFLSISVVSMVNADSVDTSAQSDAAPADRIVSHPVDNRGLDIELKDNPALAETSDTKDTSGWSEIWE